MNDRLIKALTGQPVDCVPMWLMRQAGRYLPEYRAIRAKIDFNTLIKTPSLCCEVALQPLARFDLDAAIVFSDILTIPDAMGLGLYFTAGEGPCFERPIQNAADIAALGVPDMYTDLGYVSEAVATLVAALKGRIPVIGFSGSPWTLATYMVEGKSSRHFERIKSLLFNEPATLHRLLELLTESVKQYLQAQINAGAKVVMLFDSWGGVLDTDNYRSCSLAYMRDIVHDLKQSVLSQHVPIILFTKGGGGWLTDIADTNCHAIGVDWTVNLGTARQQIGHAAALQGNLDPVALYAKPATIKQLVKQMFESLGDKTGYVFNLGHGILPATPPEHVSVLVEAVKRYGQVTQTARETGHVKQQT